MGESKLSGTGLRILRDQTSACAEEHVKDPLSASLSLDERVEERGEVTISSSEQ